MPEASDWENNEDIKLFREYLRIDTTTAHADYEKCYTLFEKFARDTKLEFNAYYPVNNKKKPVIVISWIGEDPSLPSIMLNSHMDVVPAEKEFWTHDPFAADIDEKGNIIARGTQDTKGLGIMFLGAIRSMKESKVKLKRTLHVTFVPDEEIGGADGMKAFVQSDDFKNLKVGFALDESGPTPLDGQIIISIGERTKWTPVFNVTGKPTHGSVMEEGTAPEKLIRILDKAYKFRDSQMKILAENQFATGETVSVNATVIQGGQEMNVVPAKIVLKFDIRVGPRVDHEKLEESLREWAREEDVKFGFESKDPFVGVTELDESDPLWVAMKKALSDMGYETMQIVLPATTDSRFLREQKIKSIGFLPVTQIDQLAHGHNEYMPAEKFLHGIDVMKKVLANMGNA